MGWFRAYRKCGGRLALAALALQFYLSFAHIHPEDIYGPVGGSLSAAQSVVLPSAQSLKAVPSDEPWYSGEAFCPICETIYFLATSFNPKAPQVLPRPIVCKAVPPFLGITALVIAPRRAPFQSRAPPVA